MGFWHKAFKVCSVIFGITLTIAIIALFTNWLLPDDIFNDPAYSAKYVGVKELVAFIKTIDTADFYVTIFSGIATAFTYIIKNLDRISIQ